jgi:poly(A) polymerase
VRDAVLGMEAKDVDAATPLPPDQVMRLLAESSVKTVPTGIAHGTVMAVINGHGIEITTLRRDVATDGRRATVSYTDDWQADAARRDFTMNALYCDASGGITDFFHGIEDALAGRVRFIGDPNARIREDALRILRYFRFLAFYGHGEPDPEAIAACAAGASQTDMLSGERISQEMLKLLVSDTSADAIRLMREAGTLAYVIPGKISADPLKKLALLRAGTGYPPDPILALALLLRSEHHDVAARMKAVSGRWKLSKSHCRLLYALCGSRLQLTAHEEKSWKKQIRMLGKDMFIKQAVMRMAEGMDEAAGREAISLASSWEIPEFPLNGDDLVRQGVAPGAGMGVLLKRLEAYWEEEGYAPDKKALLAVGNRL